MVVLCKVILKGIPELFLVDDMIEFTNLDIPPVTLDDIPPVTLDDIPRVDHLALRCILPSRQPE